MESDAERDVIQLLRRAIQVRRSLTRVLVSAFVIELGFSLDEAMVLRSVSLGFSGPSEIARRLAQPAPTVARALNHLAERGLVHLADHPRDHRRRVATATPAGLAMLERAEATAVAAFRQAHPLASPVVLRQAAQALDALWNEIGSNEGYPDDPHPVPG